MAAVTKSLAWFLGYAYSFDIGNQRAGIEEDKLNIVNVACKANRPLARGDMSVAGAEVRHIVSEIYYLAISWVFGGAKLSLPALAWIITSRRITKAGNSVQ